MGGISGRFICVIPFFRTRRGNACTEKIAQNHENEKEVLSWQKRQEKTLLTQLEF